MAGLPSLRRQPPANSLYRLWPIQGTRRNVGKGSTSARRPRGEACRRPSWRRTARRRRPDPTRPASVKNPDTSGAAGPPKAMGRRGALAGHQPPLRVFLHCSRSTRAVLHTGHSIGATRSIRLNFGHAAVGAVLGTVGAGPWATVLLSPRPAVQPLHADLAGGG